MLVEKEELQDLKDEMADYKEVKYFIVSENISLNFASRIWRT
jgi:hypothetical protein